MSLPCKDALTEELSEVRDVRALAGVGAEGALTATAASNLDPFWLPILGLVLGTDTPIMLSDRDAYVIGLRLDASLPSPRRNPPKEKCSPRIIPPSYFQFYSQCLKHFMERYPIFLENPRRNLHPICIIMGSLRRWDGSLTTSCLILYRLVYPVISFANYKIYSSARTKQCVFIKHSQILLYYIKSTLKPLLLNNSLKVAKHLMNTKSVNRSRSPQSKSILNDICLITLRISHFENRNVFIFRDTGWQTQNMHVKAAFMDHHIDCKTVGSDL